MLELQSPGSHWQLPCSSYCDTSIVKKKKSKMSIIETNKGLVQCIRHVAHDDKLMRLPTNVRIWRAGYQRVTIDYAERHERPCRGRRPYPQAPRSPRPSFSERSKYRV